MLTGGLCDKVRQGRKTWKGHFLGIPVQLVAKPLLTGEEAEVWLIVHPGGKEEIRG